MHAGKNHVIKYEFPEEFTWQNVPFKPKYLVDIYSFFRDVFHILLTYSAVTKNLMFTLV